MTGDRPPQSGYVGVAYHRHSGKWYASISVQGKRRSLGYYDTPEAAAAAYQAAAAERALLPKRRAPIGSRALNQPAAKSARLVILLSLDDAGPVDTLQIARAWGISRRTIQRELALLPKMRHELAQLRRLAGLEE